MKGKDAAKLCKAMWTEIHALQQISSFAETNGLENINILHNRFALQPKRYEMGNMEEFEARLVACSKEENDNDHFFSLLVFIIL